MTCALAFVVAGWLLVAAPALQAGPEPVAVEAETLVRAAGFSLRFFGNGTGQVDRVVIPIDNPETPADIGDDFTIEFWLKANPGENSSGPCVGGLDAWTRGNIIVDRDIFGTPDAGDFGVSLFGGRIAFGTATASSGQSVCGSTRVDDGAWHHIALTRRRSTGRLEVFVDGRPDGSGSGPAGSLAYRNGRLTNWSADPFLVIGAEKHDYDSKNYPSFRGWLDELRLSTIVRYAGVFSPPRTPFEPDSDTAALYHFDEGPAGPCRGDIVDAAPGGRSTGRCNYGGSPSPGPVYSVETPFSADRGDLRVRGFVPLTLRSTPG